MPRGADHSRCHACAATPERELTHTSHYTQDQLRRYLTKAGLRDRDGRTLSRTSLNDLLKNPFYWGLMRWHGLQQQGTHPPATDRRTWERCQAVTAKHAGYVSRQRKHVFLLTGLTVCAICKRHHTHTVNRRKRKRYYNCNRLYGCTQPYIPEELLERQVTKTVESIHLTDEFIALVVKKVREVFARREARLEQQKRALLRRRTVTEQKRHTAEQKLLRGVLSDEAFKRLVPEITVELDEINQKLQDLEAAR